MATTPIPAFTTTEVARAAAGLFDYQLGQVTMQSVLSQIAASGGDVYDAANMFFTASFAGYSHADVAAIVVKNVGVTTDTNTPAEVADAVAYVTAILDGAAPGTEGATILHAIDTYATFPASSTYGDAAAAFDAQISAATGYASIPGSADTVVHPDLPQTNFFTLLHEQAGTADVMHIDGNQNIRIDFTNPAHQITGFDINGDGTIATDGKENNPTFLEANVAAIGAEHSGFEIVDAYPRNPLNSTDTANNFTGNIYFDGTGFAGDGKTTNGNIFLGGLGQDIAFGGIGNDFLTGGGNTGGINGSGFSDYLSGGRNADGFFLELSQLSTTDGNGIVIDGGVTADATAPGSTQSNQDNDWLLLEGSDDDEPITYDIDEGTVAPGVAGPASFLNNLTTRSGTAASVYDTENVNASGNLFGFLDSREVSIGARATDLRSTAPVAGTTNFGIGSTAQLIINGSSAANTIIGGFDNDNIHGGTGNDVLFGGDLRFLLRNHNNPNLLDANSGLAITNSGKDSLSGDAGADAIVFQSGGGFVDGGTDVPGAGTPAAIVAAQIADASRDDLYLTDFSFGRVLGTTDDTSAAETASITAGIKNNSAVAAPNQDPLGRATVVRLDLGVGEGVHYSGYGGADVNNNKTGLNQATRTADQTQYATSTDRVTVQNIEGVIATGLGAIDYTFAGGNKASDQTTTGFVNQQNYNGITADLDLRGSTGANWLIANAGHDVVEGREGNDILSGGRGNDDFFFQNGDNVDIVERQADTNGDGIWDTDATSGSVVWSQDFRANDVTTGQIRVHLHQPLSDSYVIQEVKFTINGDAFDYLGNDKDIDSLVANLSAYIATQPGGENLSIVKVDNQTFNVVNTLGTAPEGSTIFITSISPPGDYGYDVGQTSFGSDRLLFKDYLDRNTNTGIDDTKYDLTDASAATLAVGYITEGGQTSTVLVEGQAWAVKLDNIGAGDTVSVTVNGKTVTYTFKEADIPAGVGTALATFINNTLQDQNSRAGFLVAAASGDGQDTIAGADSLGHGTVTLTQSTGADYNLTETYMAQPVVGLINTGTSTSSTIASATVTDVSHTSVDLFQFNGANGLLDANDVLFVGRTGQSTGYVTADSTSILQTAKDAGDTLVGKNATIVPVVAVAPQGAQNSKSADGKTAGINGDDLLLGGAGNDIISGGTGDDLIIASKGLDTVYGGSAGGPDNDGAGLTLIKYTDSLVFDEGNFSANGAKFNIKLAGELLTTGKGTTTATDAVTGAPLGVTTFDQIEVVRTLSNTAQDSLDVSAVSAAIIAATAAGGAQGSIVYNFTVGGQSVSYLVDKDGDGLFTSPGEKVDNFVRVYGVENFTNGNTNDIVNFDASQIQVPNIIDLGGGTNGPGTKLGQDTVVYSDATVAAVDVPAVTIKVGTGDTDLVSMTGGKLGSTVVTDTLINTEVVDINGVRSSPVFNGLSDTLDLSNFGATGATVNFSNATAQPIGKSAGGANAAPLTVATNDANVLVAGGISPTGTTVGTEALIVKGIENIEKIMGSTGPDRVIAAATYGVNQTPGAVLDVASNSGLSATAFSLASTVAVSSLYSTQFDLGTGLDVIDYRNETVNTLDAIVGFGGASDSILSVVGAAAAVTSHVDLVKKTGATDYNGYFAKGGAASVIDLSNAPGATTVTFSATVINDPNGEGVPDSDIVRGAQVTVDSAPTVPVAVFYDQKANASSGAGQNAWNWISGSGFADTLKFTNFEDSLVENGQLLGGANVVDYSGLTTVVGTAVDATIVPGGLSYAVTPNNGGVADTFTIVRNADGDGITLVGTNGTKDSVSISALGAPTEGAFGSHLVNLATGSVVEDQDTNVFIRQAAPAAPLNGDNIETTVKNFENVKGSAFTDVIVGNGANNVIDAGPGADRITGNGGADSIDVGVGDAAADRVYYASANDGNVLGSLTFAGADSVVGFGAGDKVVINNTLTSAFAFPQAAARAAAAFNLNTEGLIFGTTAVTATKLDTFANVNTAIGALTGEVVGRNAIFVLNDGTDSGIYAYHTNVADGVVTADELTLLSVVKATVLAPATQVAERISSPTTPLTLDAVTSHEIVYAAVGDSVGGTADTLNGFVAGRDKIDLSAIVDSAASAVSSASLDEITDGGLQTTAAITALLTSGGSVFADTSPLTLPSGPDNNFVYVTHDATSTTILVDVNQNGNYEPGTDMVITLSGVIALTLNDFIFVGGAPGN